MTAPRASDFVTRCQVALEEYTRLRFLGICHEIAVVQSGFRDAVMNKPVEQIQLLRDVKALVSGERE